MGEQLQPEHDTLVSDITNGEIGSLYKDLLKRWLSVAESQICALEVLCSQLPKVNGILEDNMMDLSASFSELATETQHQTKNVVQVKETARHVEVNGKSQTIEAAVAYIEGHLDSGDAKGALKQIKLLQKALKEQEKVLDNALEVAQVSVDQMVTAISTAIVGMQFQDRVSQNIVIAEKVLKEIVYYLQASVNETLSNLTAHSQREDGKNGKSPLDVDFARQLMAHLNLGELQGQFVDHLVEHHYIKDASELGVKDTVSQQQNDDVELF